MTQKSRPMHNLVTLPCFALLQAFSICCVSANADHRNADSTIQKPSQFSESKDSYCPPYSDSDIFRPRREQITVGPDDDWKRTIERAPENTTVLLKDGNYLLDDYAVLLHDNITLRSQSGNRHAVTIRGKGYKQLSEGLMIVGNNVTIADLSVTGIRNHAIAIKPAQGARIAPYIYNVHLFDIGTQHIKGNQPGTRDGIVGCSLIGNTPDGIKGDYNGAIDLHAAVGWLLHDNVIYNIRGDGTGCEVDQDCGTYISGPAILVWNKAKDTVIERNYIFDSFRNIALGLGRGHTGGRIRNNIIIQVSPGDAGIELQTASDLLVEHNTVVLHKNYPGTIEYRDSSNLLIQHNLVSAVPFDRGDNRKITLVQNKVDNTLAATTEGYYQSVKKYIDQLHTKLATAKQ